MSVAVNYYLGIARGQTENPGNVVARTSSGATAADVELRMQIDNGTGLTGLTKLDVDKALCLFRTYILSNWPTASGQGVDLPPL